MGNEVVINQFLAEQNQMKIGDMLTLQLEYGGMSDLSGGSLRSQLKTARIDTNSAQYKAAVKQMTKHAGWGRSLVWIMRLF